MPAEQVAPVFGQDFDAFMSYLRASKTSAVISPARYGDALGLDVQSLADSAGVHRNTVARAPEALKLQRYLRDAVRALRAATDLNGNVENTLYWFSNTPLPAFGYKTPHMVVSEGHVDALLNYVASLHAGFAG